MIWWAWLIAGLALAAAELLADTAFYLLFAGFAALVVGLAGLFGLGLPAWAQWAAFAVLAVASMVLFRRKLHDRLFGRIPELRHAAMGAVVAMPRDLAPAKRTRVRLQGTEWTAVNVGSAPIASGADARVIGMDGVELRIRREGGGEPRHGHRRAGGES